MLAHVVEELGGYFHKGLLRKHVRVVLEVVVRHKLDDVSSHVLAIGVGVQGFIVTIERLHAAEVGITDANNNDGHGQLGASHDLVDRLVHIIDDAIGDNDEDVELLGTLRLQVTFDMSADFVQDFRKVSRSVELRLLKSVLVGLRHTLDALDARIEDVAVQREAVRGASVVGWDSTTKAIEVDQLIGVVELKNVADILDSLQVLVALRVEIVKR